MTFKKGNTIIPQDVSVEDLMQVTGATLRLSNQKNGACGALIHRSAMEGGYCPVRALVQRFLHLCNHHATLDTIISAYWDHLGSGNVTDVDIRRTVKRAVLKLDLAKNEITEGRVGTYSLCAGGAMAIKFAGGNRDDIKKMGR